VQKIVLSIHIKEKFIDTQNQTTNTTISPMTSSADETTVNQTLFVPPSKIAKKYNRLPITFRRWAEQGKIEHIITPTGRYLYNMVSTSSARDSRTWWTKSVAEWSPKLWSYTGLTI
jgi:hypothetical protein